MKRLISYMLGAAAVTLIALSGCSQQQTQTAGADFNHGVAVANQKADTAVREAQPKMAALDLGARVTAALQVNQNLPHTGIRVDASPNGVRLRGVVATKHQKQIAMQIAKDTLGPGKTVDDELTVKGA
jgi:hypothetical protein